MTKYTIRDKNDKKVYIIKEKVKDAVSLRKGDWFVINKRSDKNNYLYKVIDDQFRVRDGYFHTLLAEVYQIEPKYVYIKKYSTKEFLSRELKNISVFGSAAEAIKWLKHRLAIAERDIVEDRVNDILQNYYIEHNGDVYSAIEVKKGSDDERLFLKALKGFRIQYKKSENTHSGKGYVSYYDFR